MGDKVVRKGLVVGIIVLFICVSYQTVFAVDNKSSIDNTQNENDCICKIDSNIQQIRFEKLLNRLEIHIQKLLLIDKYKELFNKTSTTVELNLELKSDLHLHENFTICLILVTIASIYLSGAELCVYLANIFYRLNNTILTDFFLHKAEKFLDLIDPIFDDMSKFGCIP